jgi:hypothetical protein
MINYAFNNELNILETHFKNDIYLSDVIDYIIAITESTHFPKTLKILTYAETATFKFTVNDLQSINNKKNDGLVNYDFVMNAIIIDGPETAAISVLYEALSENNKYQFKVFSTKEYALNWLLNNKI